MCVVGSNIIRERVRFEVKMHPVSVSIPSFRSETSPMEKGFTVSCPTTTSVCLSAGLLLSSGLFFHFFHSNVASVSCWDGFCHLRAASDFGSLIKKKIVTRDREGISVRLFCPNTSDRLAFLELCSDLYLKKKTIISRK